METHAVNACLLLIGAKDHTLKKLKEMNVCYVLIQSQGEALTLEGNEQVVFVETYEDQEQLCKLALELHQIHQFKAVVSFTEFGLYAAAFISEKLQVKGNHLFPVEHTRDKYKMRLLLEKNNLSTLLYQPCNNIKEVKQFYKKIKMPFILKPTQGVGSKGVFYIQSLEEIQKAWDWVAQHQQYLIAEEYLLGKEYSVESLSLDGNHSVLAITEKHTTGFPHFIETGHYSPALLNQEQEQKIQQLIIHFLNTIKQYNGPTHTEIKIHEKEIKIIESQTRMGGDQIWELTELTTGVDVISETISHLLGIKKKFIYKKAKAAAILFFAREYEEILQINNSASSMKVPGILRVHCNLKIGQTFGKLHCSESRQGYILGIGNTLYEAKQSVQLAMKHLQIKTKVYLVEN